MQVEKINEEAHNITLYYPIIKKNGKIEQENNDSWFFDRGYYINSNQQVLESNLNCYPYSFYLVGCKGF